MSCSAYFLTFAGYTLILLVRLVASLMHAAGLSPIPDGAFLAARFDIAEHAGHSDISLR